MGKRLLAHLDRPRPPVPKRRPRRLPLVSAADVAAGMDALFDSPAPAVLPDAVADDAPLAAVGVSGGGDVRDLDQLTGELQRLSERREVVQARLLALEDPDEDRMKLYVRQLAVIAESQRECVRTLRLLHDGRLRDAQRVRALEVRIVDASGVVVGGLA